MKICAIVLAAGQGTRMEMPSNKVFLKFDGNSAVVRSVRAHSQTGLFDKIIVACREDEIPIIKTKLSRYAGHANIEYVAGGEQRQYSVKNALALVEKNTDIVSVHDAARCFVSQQIIQNCVTSAIRRGSGVAAVPATDTVKRVIGDKVVETLNRSELVCVQTPQAFRYALLKEAYDKADAEGFLGTDDASLVERLGLEVFTVPGSQSNIKITNATDIQKGNNIVGDSSMNSNLRIGSGLDVHAFTKDRKLVLGGVDIPCEFGLDGHSDADVLVHAIMDALAGAARLGDIGELFPPEDDKYKGISSMLLLEKVGELLNNLGYTIINIDATLMMQKPKILDYKKSMMKNIAGALHIDMQYISIKATTTEHLGFVGRTEGAMANAVCIIQKHT